MHKYLEFFALGTGVGGVGLALVAGLGRLVGVRYLAGVESLSLLIAAIALMAASCVAQLYLLRQR